MNNLVYKQRLLSDNGWSPIGNIKEFIPSLYNIHLKLGKKNGISVPSKNEDKNRSSVFIIEPKEFLSLKEGKKIFDKLLINDDYLSNLNLETIYYVIDKKGSEHRNHVWHFDTYLKTKIMLHIKGCNPSTATQFLSKSHKSFYPRFSNFLSKISRNRILISKKGATTFLFLSD